MYIKPLHLTISPHDLDIIAFITVAFVPVLLHLVSLSNANPDAKRLYNDLLVKSGYNKLIRPVANNTEVLTVKLGLRLSQLIGIVSIFFYMAFWSVYYRPVSPPLVTDLLLKPGITMVICNLHLPFLLKSQLLAGC